MNSMFPKRINLITDESENRDGYWNVPWNAVEQLEPSGAEEILCGCLEKIPPQQFDAFLNVVLTKLRHRGIIRLLHYDLLEVARIIYTENRHEEMVRLLYGSGFRHALMFHQMAEWATNNGLKVLTHELDGIKVLLEAQRP